MLKIDFTNAMINIQTQNASLTVNTTNPKLDIHQELPKVQINTEPVRVSIDQSRCFSEMGLKSCRELIKQAASKGLENAAEYISKVASDGDTMAEINDPGKTFARMAVRDAFPQKDFNITCIPKSMPEITASGEVHIDAKNGGATFDFAPGKISSNYTKGNVYISLNPKPYINIDWVGNNVDMRL